MKRALAGLALAGLAASLAACVYYPHGPYGPGYGPPPPSGAYGPPPGGDYGPPPGTQGGPPPGGDYGPPPGGPGGPQGGPPPGYGGPQGGRMLTERDISNMNNPDWCAQHPHHCKKLQKEFAAQQGGQYGPPPGAGQYGPPPQGQYQGPPQRDNDDD